MSAGDAHAVTVRRFLDAGAGRLSMELVAGRSGLGRRISETALNRPGLALSGFLDYFPQRRIQVIGLAEISYLASLDAATREQRLRAFFQRHVPCLVVTRHRGIGHEFRDLAEEFSTPVLRSRMVTKHFMNAATIVMEDLAAPQEIVQGTMVEIMGIGVLIEGKAGMGKSEAALALIRRGYALVADDVTVMRRDSSGSLVGSASDATRFHMEIRGLGIIHVPSLFGVASVRNQKRLDLVASLVPPGAETEGMRAGGDGDAVGILGANVKRICIPVAPGRDLANVIEAAALNEKLKRLGHDAEKELDEKLMALMSEGIDASE
ncbi:MAG: HPr(Ser) kinase/phosphatase [Lentisphaerae bacterium]|nr:HPr(Ser) kinase/phosphatase [Lentisphaerota bacterium]